VNPQVDEIVVARVTSVQPRVGVYTGLAEYGNIPAFIALDEVSRARRGRNNPDDALTGVSEGDMLVCVVTGIGHSDDLGTTIDLSARNVSRKASENARQSLRRAVVVDRVVRHAANTVLPLRLAMARRNLDLYREIKRHNFAVVNTPEGEEMGETIEGEQAIAQMAETLVDEEKDLAGQPFEAVSVAQLIQDLVEREEEKLLRTADEELALPLIDVTVRDLYEALVWPLARNFCRAYDGLMYDLSEDVAVLRTLNLSPGVTAIIAELFAADQEDVIPKRLEELQERCQRSNACKPCVDSDSDGHVSKRRVCRVRFQDEVDEDETGMDADGCCTAPSAATGTSSSGTLTSCSDDQSSDGDSAFVDVSAGIAAAVEQFMRESDDATTVPARIGALEDELVRLFNLSDVDHPSLHDVYADILLTVICSLFDCTDAASLAAFATKLSSQPCSQTLEPLKRSLVLLRSVMDRFKSDEDIFQIGLLFRLADYCIESGLDRLFLPVLYYLYEEDVCDALFDENCIDFIRNLSGDYLRLQPHCKEMLDYLTGESNSEE